MNLTIKYGNEIETVLIITDIYSYQKCKLVTDHRISNFEGE